MKAVLVVLAACAAEPAEPDVIEASKCNAWFCGTNSPVMDGLDFHELNINGLANKQGFSMGAVTVGQSTYQMTVQQGEFVAERITGNGPAQLTNFDVVDLEIPIRHGNLTHGLKISEIDETSFWAHASLTQNFVTYVIEWDPTFGQQKWQPLCATPSSNNSDNLDMNEYRALVFEGERIDEDSKTIKPTLDPTWFNIGCAGSTLAKLHLTGHTQAADEIGGFSNTILQRQTMVKMFSADYCGNGHPFTVAGQLLDWQDDKSTMKITTTDKSEAQWTPDGVKCLDTPRVVAHPTDASAVQFGKTMDELKADIEAVCAYPPPCTHSPQSTGVHVWTANPP